MKTKKAQIGPKEMLMTLIIAALLGIIGIVIFADVTNTSEELFSSTTTNVVNETITSSSNAATLVHGGLNTEIMTTLTGFANGSNDYASVIGTQINFTGTGELALSTALTDGSYNVTYAYDTYDQGYVTKQNLDTTILNSYEIGVISLIVLAAITMLGFLFMLGR